MKKIHLLLLRSFVKPFVVTFLIVMFVLLMLFLFKYIDDLIGKGFAWYVILQLMLYASAYNVAMALPLSILLSTIMTYGSLGENYELVAIKSAGISLKRAMYPMIVVVTLLSIFAFIFSDNMLPVANRKFLSLLYDVRQQRSATLMPEGVFSNSFPGYTIRVERKDPDGQTVYGIVIYKSDLETNNLLVTRAKQGRMYRSPGDRFLVLDLKDGVQYSEAAGEGGGNPRQTLTRFRFKTSEVKFDLSVFKLKRTDESEYKSEFQMMDLRQLNDYQKTTQFKIDSSERENFTMLKPYVRYFNLPANASEQIPKVVTDTGRNGLQAQHTALGSALSEAGAIQTLIKNNNAINKSYLETIRRSSVEYQKKFTLSAVCLVLFFIGAPLGALIRRGGLGLPVVVSVVFFLIYYIISTIGEKSVKDGNMPVILGMWIAIIVLTPVGLFLTYKAATDSALFDVDAYKKWFGRLMPWRPRLTLPSR